VTVVIPTRDAWDLLPATLTSALAQEEVDLEVVVVDDGSRDGTASGLAEWQKREPRLRVRRLESSGGVSAARNAGIEWASGEWIAFLDHDDLWAPRKLREQLDRGRQRGADWVYSAAVLVDERCRVIRLVSAPPVAELRHDLARSNHMPAGQSNVLARAEFVRDLGGFDAGNQTQADWEMWIRMAWAGSAGSCEAIHVAYRILPGSMTTFDVDVTPDVDRMLSQHAPERIHPDAVCTLADRWRASAYRRRGQRLAASRQYLVGALRHRRPEMLARSIGVLLGESAMRMASSEAWRRPPDGEPAWLARYRPAPS
jgi:glycosyltransferase involved in cell wall biosynthesis